MEIRTKKQIKTEKKHKDICSLYLSILRENNTTRHRAMAVIADRYSMSVAGIRKIVVKQGIY